VPTVALKNERRSNNPSAAFTPCFCSFPCPAPPSLPLPTVAGFVLPSSSTKLKSACRRKNWGGFTAVDGREKGKRGGVVRREGADGEREG